MNIVPSTVAAHRLADTVRARREAGAARRQLHRELAEFNTPAQVNDLLALIADSDDPGADELRTILTDNLRRCA